MGGVVFVWEGGTLVCRVSWFMAGEGGWGAEPQHHEATEGGTFANSVLVFQDRIWCGLESRPQNMKAKKKAPQL